MLSGFTIVRNAVTLDYPIVPAIRSILDMCEEVVVNVGRSDDGTRELVAGIGDPRVRILDRVWDFSRGGSTLSFETNQAMAACGGTWGVYIQADEVLHETGAALIRDRLRDWDADSRVEGLLVDYLHFYGDFSTIATDRHWYRREVRVVRLGGQIHSFQDAQGFRVGAGERRVRAAGVRFPLGQAAAQRHQLVQGRSQSTSFGGDQFGQRPAGRPDDRRAAGERLEDVHRAGILPAHGHPQAACSRQQLALPRAPDFAHEPHIA